MMRALFTPTSVCFCVRIEVCGSLYVCGRPHHRGVVRPSASLPDARSQPWCVCMTTMRDDVMRGRVRVVVFRSLTDASRACVCVLSCVTGSRSHQDREEGA